MNKLVQTLYMLCVGGLPMFLFYAIVSIGRENWYAALFSSLVVIGLGIVLYVGGTIKRRGYLVTVAALITPALFTIAP